MTILAQQYSLYLLIHFIITGTDPREGCYGCASPHPPPPIKHETRLQSFLSDAPTPKKNLGLVTES